MQFQGTNSKANAQNRYWSCLFLQRGLQAIDNPVDPIDGSASGNIQGCNFSLGRSKLLFYGCKFGSKRVALSLQFQGAGFQPFDGGVQRFGRFAPWTLARCRSRSYPR
jgi:hypothetical protein